MARARTLPRVSYRTILDLLSEAGFSRKMGETREQFARRLGAVVPTFALATHLHLAGQMGDPSGAAERPEMSRSQWRDATNRIRLELDKKTRWYRRLFGLINPFSFYRSR